MARARSRVAESAGCDRRREPAHGFAARSIAALVFALSASACGGATAAFTGTTPWEERADIRRLRVPIDGAACEGASEPLVTIVAFSDFQCRFCREAVPVIERLREAHGDSVRFCFRHLPLPSHQYAPLAAEAAEEARAQRGDEGFWRYHDALFGDRGGLGPRALVDRAAALGFDRERFEVALRGRVHAGRIDEDLELADRIGARGTPTFFLNGRMVEGALPFDDFDRLVREEVDLARLALRRGLPRAEVYARVLAIAAPEAPPENESDEEPPELDPSVLYAVPIEGAPIRGDADAAITVVLFSDFECPFCARVVPTLDALRAAYGDRMRLAFRHNPLPFHRNAALAAEAAEEARAQRGDAGFWAMHDRLFSDPRALTRADLEAHARALELDLARFGQALDARTHRATIERDQRLAQRLGAYATPTFYINGRVLQGAQPLEVFRAAFDDAAQRADQQIASGTPAGDVYDALIARGSPEAVWIGGDDSRGPPRANVPVPEHAARRGAANPDLVIQVFSDFQCPFCAQVGETLERLLAEFPNVQLVFRHLPLPFHREAHPAAIAAIEVQRQLGDAAFWRMHDRLFAGQRDLSRNALLEHATALGADPRRVAIAIDGDAHAAILDADRSAIAATGLRVGTPAFLIGDRLLLGAQPYLIFEAEVRAALAERTAVDTPSQSP